MIPLFKHVLFALLFDESAAKRWLAGIFGFVVTVAGQVFINGVEAALLWTWPQWRVAILSGVIGTILSMWNPVGRVTKPDSAAAPAP